MVSILAAALIAGTTFTSPAPVKAAPAFTGSTSMGKEISLSDFKDKYVVLEWWNHQCPYVVGQYNSGAMQKAQETLTKDGVVWISICSSAPGKQGYVTPEQANEVMKKNKGKVSHVILDANGVIGKAYKATNTPQMVLIAPNTQEILYEGASDSSNSARADAIKDAENYVLRAYNEAKAGKEVSIKSKKPFGCGVHY